MNDQSKFIEEMTNSVEIMYDMLQAASDTLVGIVLNFPGSKQAEIAYNAAQFLESRNEDLKLSIERTKRYVTM